jgi:hypothetical protein
MPQGETYWIFYLKKHLVQEQEFVGKESAVELVKLDMCRQL